MTQAIARALVPLSLLCALLVAGCSGTMGDGPMIASNSGLPDGTSTAPGQRMIGKPYKAGGRWFIPKEEPGYVETGHASWYGKELHGRRTANGEQFDAEALTAAHPTLPLPSYIRVTNLKNGKSAVLRLNDRGPFARNRLIDVSRGAADKLGFRRAGSAKVKVEYLGPAELDGGDRETLVAEAKFGANAGSSVAEAGQGLSLRNMIPFARRKPKDEGAPVEVRLASVTSDEARSAPTGDLPGVRVPARLSLVDDAPAPAATTRGMKNRPGQAPVEVASLSAAEKAQAYQDQDSAALDALVVMEAAESEPVEAVRPVSAVAEAPLPEPEPAAEPLSEAVAVPDFDARADAAFAAPAASPPVEMLRAPAKPQPAKAKPAKPQPQPATAKPAEPEQQPATVAARAPAPEPAPLAVASDVSADRISGAYDLFAAIDATAGGAGELHGVGR